MTRDLERCLTTGALVDCCRHCADDLPCDTPELDDPEETAVPAPPSPEPDGVDRLDAVVTLTWTAHVSAPSAIVETAASQLGLDRSELLTVIASQAVTRAPWGPGGQVVPVGPNGIRVTAVTLVDADVQAIP